MAARLMIPARLLIGRRRVLGTWVRRTHPMGEWAAQERYAIHRAVKWANDEDPSRDERMDRMKMGPPQGATRNDDQKSTREPPGNLQGTSGVHHGMVQLKDRGRRSRSARPKSLRPQFVSLCEAAGQTAGFAGSGPA